MKLERDQVLSTVVQVLEEDQRAAFGIELGEISEDSRPLERLQGFDSLASVSATQRCLDALGIDSKVITVFIGKDSEGKPCALTLREVVDRVLTLASRKGK